MTTIRIQKTLEPETMEITDKDLQLLWDNFSSGDRQILVLTFDDFDRMVELELEYWYGHPTKDGKHDVKSNPFWVLAETLLEVDKMVINWDRI